MKKIDINLSELALTENNLKGIANDLKGCDKRMSNLQSQFDNIAPILSNDCKYAAQYINAVVTILDDSISYITKVCSLYSEVELPKSKPYGFKEGFQGIKDYVGKANTLASKNQFSQFVKYTNGLGKSFSNDYQPIFQDWSKFTKTLGWVNRGVKGANILVQDVWDPDASNLRKGCDVAATAGVVVASGIIGAATGKAVGGIVGKAIGGALGTAIPIPIVGTVIGSVAGTFIGGAVGSIIAGGIMSKDVIGTLGGGIEAALCGDVSGAFDGMCRGTVSACENGVQAVSVAWGKMGESKNAREAVENTWGLVTEVGTQAVSVAVTAVVGAATMCAASIVDSVFDAWNLITNW
ncbi:MAG: hypothetical protein FWG51_05075 [Firmicutes bacterium]|nr:hypothetical protein [Bacillota bacterium]